MYNKTIIEFSCRVRSCLYYLPRLSVSLVSGRSPWRYGADYYGKIPRQRWPKQRDTVVQLLSQYWAIISQMMQQKLKPTRGSHDWSHEQNKGNSLVVDCYGFVLKYWRGVVLTTLARRRRDSEDRNTLLKSFEGKSSLSFMFFGNIKSFTQIVGL